MSRVVMPKPWTWFKVAPTLTHRCCECGAVHVWAFRIKNGTIEVRIRRDR